VHENGGWGFHLYCSGCNQAPSYNTGSGNTVTVVRNNTLSSNGTDQVSDASGVENATLGGIVAPHVS
jgi:hypothetical protein